MGSFDRLLEQIDAFIRKFYKNQMVKGVILFVGVFLLSFLLTTTLEYFGRFGSFTRGLLFFTFIGLNLAILINYIVIPLMRLYSFGSRIDRFQASEIIGTFFPSISDRLKNTLQLNDSLNANEGNIELLRASVMQRANNLSVVPFATAIDLKENKKYAKYLIPLFLLMVMIGIAAPGLFTQGTERVVNYSKEFIPEAPFDFVLNTADLIIEEGNDLPVEVTLKGEALPEQVYLISENGKFLMTRVSKNKFSGTIKKPKGSGVFHFEANEFLSDEYNLAVFGKAAIGKMEAKLMYPAYLGKTDEVIRNAGDLTVPEGTIIEWSLVAKNTKHVDFVFNGFKQRFTTEGIKVTKKLSENTRVSLLLANKFRTKTDSSSMNISVIKDAYPSIQVEEMKDTTSEGVRFFSGRISDDYGLNSLQFVYSVISEDGRKRESRLSVRKTAGVDMPFDFGVDFRRENVKLNDRIEYYFVVTDNDGVNGNKATRSQVYTYKLPSLEELNEKRDEEQQQAKEDLNDLLNRTKEFQKNIDKLKKDVLNSNKSDWNKMNQVEQLKEEQKNLLESLENMQQMMEQSTQQKDQLSEMDKELLEKQEMIDKLLEELMDDELRKLLDDLEKLLEKNDKEGMKENLEDLEQSSEDMKKQLDRSLEMLKRLQVNEKSDDIEKELKELSKEQEELKKDVLEEKISKEKAVEKQDEINKKFDELKEDLQELKDLNKELDKPMNLGDTEESEKAIEEDLNESKESLENSKEKKAAESQQSASDEMKKMAEQLDQMQQQSNQQQQQEDINSLRNILESLMALSFDQEDLMLRFARVGDLDPAYRRYGRKQRAIIDDTEIVRDSLLALAKRQPKIASFVDKELNAIKENHALSLEDIDEHRKRELNVHQQSVMTSYNNLALLLNESLQSMQQQMQSMMEGSGSCNNPGGKGKPKPGSSMNPGDMKQMLKKQLEQMQKGMGPNPNGDKPGDQPGQNPGGKEGMGMQGLGNKQIAKMAAEQTAIRQRLEQLRNELNKEGKGKGNQLNPLIQELEEQEKELINKKFSPDMINRQKEILTRLLESEKALMERGFEEKRESQSGKNENYGNKIRFDEYNSQKLKQIELLRSVDPVYRKYYKDKANEYFNQSL
jgi:hypothetical protein